MEVINDNNNNQENVNSNSNPGKKSEKRLTAGVLALLLPFGVHKFYLGYTKAGVIQLILTFLCGIGAIICYIEGIIYLFKTDEEFDETYVQNTKEWF